MSTTKGLVTRDSLEDIADAIRAKNGSSDTYRPGDMAAAVLDLDTSGIHPAGTKQITQNGTHDVTEYAGAAVNVQPNLQSKSVTQNGVVTADSGYDGLSSVIVNVSGGGGGVSTGTEPPSNDTGANGDFYIQTYQGGILSSTGGATINSGVTINAMFAVETMVRVDATDSRYSTFFGCRNGSAGRFTARFANSAGGSLDIQKSATPTASYASITTTFTKSGMQDNFNRLLVGLDRSNNADDFPYPMYLYNNNNAGIVGDDYGDFSMKYFLLTDENGFIAQYLIPAEDNGEACMLDLIDGTYHKNIGNGSFTYTADGGISDRLLWRKYNGVWKAIKMLG